MAAICLTLSVLNRQMQTWISHSIRKKSILKFVKGNNKELNRFRHFNFVFPSPVVLDYSLELTCLIVIDHDGVDHRCDHTDQRTYFTCFPELSYKANE